MQVAVHNTTKLRQRVCGLEAAESMRQLGRAVHGPIEFAAQFAEDTIIWDLLGRPLQGFFVEVGAFDGRTFSVSLAFEQMGWKGLLVEPIPERAAQCKANRPGSKVVHAAVGGPEAKGETSFTVTEDHHGGMLSFRGQATLEHRRELNEMKVKERSVTVPFANLADLLEGCIERVDAAIIDVEGSEVETLKGLNLEKYRPRVLVIEDDPTNAKSAVSQFMPTTEYLQVATLACNRVYVHRDEKEIFARIPTLG